MDLCGDWINLCQGWSSLSFSSTTASMGDTFGALSTMEETPLAQRWRPSVVAQRKRHHQRDHQLYAIRTSVAAVAPPRFGILLPLPFEVRAGQIVEQHFEIGAEQIGPFLLQVN